MTLQDVVVQLGFLSVTTVVMIGVWALVTGRFRKSSWTRLTGHLRRTERKNKT